MRLLGCVFILGMVPVCTEGAFARSPVVVDFDRARALYELREARQDSSLPKEGMERLDAAIADLERARFVPEGRPSRGTDEDLKKFKGSPAYGFLNAEERVQLEKLSRHRSEKVPSEDILTMIPDVDQLRYASAVSERVPEEVRRGDLVLRTDMVFLSHCFVEASSREKRFSHIGVVQRGGTHPRILSVEYCDSKGASCVSIVEWHNFLRTSVDCAVYRFAGDANIGERIARAAEKRIGILFDPAFDLKTKDRLYCSELVRDAVNEAVGKPVIGTTKKGTFEYVAIDDCYRSGWTKIFDAKEGK